MVVITVCVIHLLFLRKFKPTDKKNHNDDDDDQIDKRKDCQMKYLTWVLKKKKNERKLN